MTGGAGTVYLIHFDRRYKHAGHYIGWAKDLNARLAEHARGQGARLMAVITQAGITWRLARTWEGTRARERQIKNQGGASRCCPHCGVTPRPRTTGPPGRPARAATVRRPASLPGPARVPPYERGAATARRWIGQQIAAGYSADRITVIQHAMARDYDPCTARPQTREFHRGYQNTAAALIEEHRQAATVLACRPPDPGAPRPACTLTWAAFTEPAAHGTRSR